MSYIQDLGTFRGAPRGASRQEMGGLWDSVKNIGSGVAKGALDIYGDSKKQQGAAELAAQQAAAQQQQQPGGMPGWIIPVAIGAAGLVAVVLITRKK